MSATGWGRVFDYRHDEILPASVNDVKMDAAAPIAFHGMGRSYGDVALNDRGTLVHTRLLDGILDANWKKGILRAEAGLTLNTVLQECIPRGWFPKVVPGTRFVTLGGAVANDIHGKNHHRVGSFGSSVLRIGLQRSDSDHEEIVLSRTEHADLFTATLGGLGLTGFIRWVEIELQAITSSDMAVENIPCRSLKHFFELSEESADWPYTVAWLDCFAKGDALGRGIFTRARHGQSEGPLNPGPSEPALTMRFDLPSFVLNRHSVGAFNRLYAARPGARFCGTLPYQSFFFPLDGIAHWNRMYGKRGFFQHQSLLPPERAEAGLRTMLESISAAGQGSFLAVLKRYGAERSPGLMTFGGEGYSLALDFANKGDRTRALLARLDGITVQHGGRIYAAKDATMSAETFQAGYPQWRELEKLRDPALSSSFWRRVSATQ